MWSCAASRSVKSRWQFVQPKSVMGESGAGIRMMEEDVEEEEEEGGEEEGILGER